MHSHYFAGYLDSQIHKFKNSVFGICVCTTQKCQINQFFSLTAPSNGSLLTLIAVLTLPTHKIFHKPNGTPSTVFDNFEPKHQTISSSWKKKQFFFSIWRKPLWQSLSSDGAKFFFNTKIPENRLRLFPLNSILFIMVLHNYSDF